MFRVAYLGNSVMDRRYPSDLQPWVMAEMRRMGTTTPVVLSAISGGSVLHALPIKAIQGTVQVRERGMDCCQEHSDDAQTCVVAEWTVSF